MEFKHLSDSTRKRLKILRILTGKTYEELIDDALSKYYLNAIEANIKDSTEVVIHFSLPAKLYNEFNKSVSKMGFSPSDILSFCVDLWVENERTDSM